MDAEAEPYREAEVTERRRQGELSEAQREENIRRARELVKGIGEKF